MHLAVGPLRAIGDDQSRGCDIPTGPCSQSIGNDGSFIVKSNELLAQISALASGKRPVRRARLADGLASSIAYARIGSLKLSLRRWRLGRRI